MEAVFNWQPILWAGRILVLLLLSGSAAVIVVVLLRVLRPSSVRALLAGELPSLRSVRGRVRVGGQELEADVEMDSERDVQVLALGSRLDELEAVSEHHREILERLLSEKERDAHDRG